VTGRTASAASGSPAWPLRRFRWPSLGLSWPVAADRPERANGQLATAGTPQASPRTSQPSRTRTRRREGVVEFPWRNGRKCPGAALLRTPMPGQSARMTRGWECCCRAVGMAERCCSRRDTTSAKDTADMSCAQRAKRGTSARSTRSGASGPSSRSPGHHRVAGEPRLPDVTPRAPSAATEGRRGDRAAGSAEATTVHGAIWRGVAPGHRSKRRAARPDRGSPAVRIDPLYCAYFWRISFLSSLPTLVLSSAGRDRTPLGTAHRETTPLSAYPWTCALMSSSVSVSA
jgi:hypothetical protein